MSLSDDIKKIYAERDAAIAAAGEKKTKTLKGIQADWDAWVAEQNKAHEAKAKKLQLDDAKATDDEAAEIAEAIAKADKAADELSKKVMAESVAAQTKTPPGQAKKA